MRSFQRFAGVFVLLSTAIGVVHAGDDAETLRRLAIETLTRKLVAAKNEPDANQRYAALFQVGRQLKDLGETDGARSAFLSAREVDKQIQGERPRDSLSQRSYFARLLSETGAKAEAREILREAIDAVQFDKDPNEAFQRFFETQSLICAQIDIGDVEGARISLKKIERVEDRIDNPGLKQNMRLEKPKLVARLGSVKEALELARAVEADQQIDAFRGMALLGVAEYLPKRFSKEIDAAFEEAQQAILANPDSFHRNQNFIIFVIRLVFADRLDRAVELADAMNSEEDPRFGAALKFSHANALDAIGSKLVETKKKPEAILFARKARAICSGIDNEFYKRISLSQSLRLFRDAGDPQGAGEALAALAETRFGAEANNYWIVADALRRDANKNESRIILDRCLKRLEKRIADLRAGKSAPNAEGEPILQLTVPADQTDHLLALIAELADTHFLLGDRAEGFRAIDSLTDMAQRDLARGKWAVFRVEADDPSTALELLKTIQDPTRRDEATIDAALQLKIKK